MADHIGWFNGSPRVINGYRPDLVVENNGLLSIIEVETTDSIMDAHTIRQLQAFSKSNLPTYIVIPRETFIKGTLTILKANLSRHKLNVRIGICDLQSEIVNFDV
ncbi:hypothetical protein D3C81_1867190 [compost metagenome]